MAHKLCRVLLLLLLLLTPTVSRAVELKVRVFSSNKVHQASFTVVKGYYVLRAEGHEKTLSRFQQVTLRAEGGRVVVIRNNHRLFSASQITLSGQHEDNIFRLIPSGLRERDYDDGLKVTAHGSHLIFINQVELEHYVAGVVLSEVGIIEVPEYYKIQDIISRTYALQNLGRHQQDGHQLCDAEHCQVYKSRCFLPDILESISVTRGDVIVDSSGRLITAAFHSNSGGYTLPSEAVWSGPLPYLKGVQDTFSLAMSKAFWADTLNV
ncbi:MAG TPA: SpoIID/LytB domain-containing protein, partial [Bacteroidales bacterium]|nr:SpoIID/LytB domain-containing protein [Bacteroidales bacterium]